MTTQLPPPAHDQLRVEMWSDFICPWCGIGERRFKQALNDFPHHDNVRITLRSYRLMPGSAAKPVEEILRDKYELLPDEITAGLSKLEAEAATVGLTYNMAGSWGGDTLDGHRLVKLAEQSGKEFALFHRLFMAAMSERLPLHDHAVLRNLAVETGLDAEEVDAVLGGNRYHDEVEADEAAMKRHGGRGVPFFVINDRHDYSGALAPDIFLNALRKAWEDAKSADAGGAGVPLCGPDGCILPSA